MAQYEVKIRISADTPAEVQELGNLIQNTVNNVDNADMVKLLGKVRNNPKIVKTALKFI